MIAAYENVYARLYLYCKERDFKGADPFDGLNSRIFQALPLKSLAPARLAWLQLVKRSRKDLRPLLSIPPGENPKSLALFALAELARFRTTHETGHQDEAASLLDRLEHQSIKGRSTRGQSTLSFGYDFDWQSRQFFAPRGTPAIVPTAFAAKAYLQFSKTLNNDRYIQSAGEICEFIVDGLQRPVESGDEICFSYTPKDNGIIYNASLLAGEVLGTYDSLVGIDDHIELAKRAANFVVRHQSPDGSWFYGPKVRHRWVDNFHTAFVLVSLNNIAKAVGQTPVELDASIDLGFDHWTTNFFLQDGTPKYYQDRTWPVDIHSAATAIWALCELSERFPNALALAEKVSNWTIENLLDDAGYFYYQMRRGDIVKTSFMRWGQAWMALALSTLIEKLAAREGTGNIDRCVSG